MFAACKNQKRIEQAGAELDQAQVEQFKSNINGWYLAQMAMKYVAMAFLGD